MKFEQYFSGWWSLRHPSPAPAGWSRLGKFRFVEVLERMELSLYYKEESNINNDLINNNCLTSKYSSVSSAQLSTSIFLLMMML